MTQSAVGLIDRCELNGAAASTEDLRVLATTNYGHFTAMQVEPGGVRGLDLHLARLDDSTRELFGQPLDGALVREYMRSALGGFDGAASMRVNVFSRKLHRDRMAEPAPPDVVVSVGAPRRIETTPVRLKSFRYERVLPH
ncbi:MAG TPA: class IV aminotransferase, partial [Rhodanobacteraceae bacterium]|nr:class IV aminotransferase [Rhodanobacteraceae bacterium]